jgi:hypothetical protein
MSGWDYRPKVGKAQAAENEKENLSSNLEEGNIAEILRNEMKADQDDEKWPFHPFSGVDPNPARSKGVVIAYRHNAAKIDADIEILGRRDVNDDIRSRFPLFAGERDAPLRFRMIRGGLWQVCYAPILGHRHSHNSG